MRISALFLILRCSIFLLMVTGCSSGTPSRGTPSADWYQNSTVEPHSDINAHSPPTLNQEIADGLYGPFPEDGQSTNPSSPLSAKKTPIVGLILGPGLNRTIAHVSILKKLEESKIKVHILSGSGMGLVVAAMYAGGMGPSKIEWTLFHFFQKFGNLPPFSNLWCKKIEELLINKIGIRRIENFPKSLVVPLYDVEQKQLRFFVKGEVKQLIKAALQLYIGGNDQGRWISAINRIIFDRKMLAHYKTDLLIGVDVLGSEIVFKEDSGFLLGNFKKIAGLIQGQKANVDVFWQLPSSPYPLDDSSDIAQFLLQGNEYIKENIQGIKTKLMDTPELIDRPGGQTLEEMNGNWPKR